ncbi:hypothetical protein BESB_029340 [Besnoitia besnoiti]|uniref:tRNA (Uracil-5-)-methyltransferase n=1 Tax=Besnoitia besnoiti TaxID=94643 RepID=A0A2A9M0M1_BESBE|nr:uncharacterized protein BESB_029340 [Besnoitia besnoiti]PFH31499.1 hypothetical protein BESB_029340 [Besnoitia besnoiti]
MEPQQTAGAAAPRRCHLACRAWSGLKQEKLSNWMIQENLPFLQLDKKHQAAWAFIDFASKEQEDAFTQRLASVAFKGEMIHIHPALPRPSARPGAFLAPAETVPTAAGTAAGAAGSPAGGARGRGGWKRGGARGDGSDEDDDEGEGRYQTKRRRRGARGRSAARVQQDEAVAQAVGTPGGGAESAPSGHVDEPHECGWKPGSPKQPLPSLFDIQKKKHATRFASGVHWSGGEDLDDDEGAEGVVQRTAPLMRFSYPDQLEMKRKYLRTNIRQLTKAVYAAAAEVGYAGLPPVHAARELSFSLDTEETAEDAKENDRTETPAETGAAPPAETGDAEDKKIGETEKGAPLPWFHPHVARRWDGCPVLPTVASPPEGRLGYRNKCEFTIGYTHEVADVYDEKLHQLIRVLEERKRTQASQPRVEFCDADDDAPACTVLQHRPRHCLISVPSHLSGAGAAAKKEQEGSDRRGARGGGASETPVGRWRLSEEDYQKYVENRARVCVGFVKRVREQQPLVAPASGSLLVSHAMQEVCHELQAIIHRSPFPVYNRRTQRGVWRLLMVRSSGRYRELLILVQVKSFSSPNNRHLRCGLACARAALEGRQAAEKIASCEAAHTFPPPAECAPGATRNKGGAADCGGREARQNGEETAKATRVSSCNGACCRQACIEALIEGLANKDFDGYTVRSIFLQESDAASDCIDPGHRTEKIWGKAFIQQSLLGLDFRVGPLSFFQTNILTCELLYQTALDFLLPLPRGTPLVDVCSGAGTITLCAAAAVARLEAKEEEKGKSQEPTANCRVPAAGAADAEKDAAKDVKKENVEKTEMGGEGEREGEEKGGSRESLPRVVGIELVEEAVRLAEENAATNHLSKDVDFICGKAEDVFPRLLQERYTGCSELAAIVDPPRAGLHTRVLEAILDFKPIKRLVYVSCNAASMVANCVKLCTPSPSNRDPFVPMRAVPVDMFPHTLHCEAVLLLCRASDVAACAAELAGKTHSRFISLPQSGATHLADGDGAGEAESRGGSTRRRRASATERSDDARDAPNEAAQREVETEGLRRGTRGRRGRGGRSERGARVAKAQRGDAAGRSGGQGTAEPAALALPPEASNPLMQG